VPHPLSVAPAANATQTSAAMLMVGVFMLLPLSC
jgi:hypothetical protein